ncbi:MAG TPA: hypothetical protein VFV50_17205, partial [Bdellovibrionales bacterium]|nr:hypothetical protein [Bdellovibrionales bacterium]
GFTPVDGSSIAEPYLRDVNDRLRAYEAWTRLLDAFVFLDPLQNEFVIDWRVEAEERMKQGGKSGMSRDEVEAYVRKFLPAYDLYLPGLRRAPPEVKAALRIQVAQDRLPIEKI